jgi:hypothetical protein
MAENYLSSAKPELNGALFLLKNFSGPENN